MGEEQGIIALTCGGTSVKKNGGTYPFLLE